MDKGQKAAEPLDKAWVAFDRVYCISLKDRSDRREAAKREFARVGLLDRVEFVVVDRHPTDSEQGIFESHMSCIRAGLAAGAQKILIFEDDVIFRRFSSKVLARAVEFMKSSGDWNVFFFGCFVYSSKKTNSRSVLRIRYRCCAHAYVVSRGFAEKLAALTWHGVAYDDLLRSLDDGKSFTCYPSFAYQSGSPTDNDKLAKIDWWRRHLGGMRMQQRWNEFSIRKRTPLIVGHLVFVVLCILLVIYVLKKK
jgi:GR25 family glycosyltransferase involved in LPS biosynthesis